MNRITKDPAELTAAFKLAKRREKAEMLARSFVLLCQRSGLPMPTREYRFDPSRRWRADFGWEEERVLLECEGAVWSGGRHTRGSGYLSDMEKYNAAAVQGWVLIRATPQDLCTDETVSLVRQAMNARVVSRSEAT
jgi:hypothetical protein